MNYIILLLISIFATGCLAVEVPTRTVESAPKPKPVKPLAKTDFVFIGMTEDEVKGVLGDVLVIGYVRNHTDQSLQPITLDSPYKKDSFSNSTGQYEVLYYYTHVGQADNIIAEDEMTPLVFEDGNLIGKGWDFLFRLKNNQ